MLIVCCGPDSYRAIARAKDLEQAFKQKHDPLGRAIERLSFGKEAVEEVIEKTSGASLFSPKRFLRADGILSSCPKNKQRALIEALSRDVESIVIVSVEDEKPSSAILSAFQDVPKFILNEYPLLKGTAFKTWAQEYARSQGFLDTLVIDKLIMLHEGDCWSFSNELIKWSAGADPEFATQFEEDSVFEIAEMIMKGQRLGYESLLIKGATQLELTIYLQQCLAYVRTLGSDVQGIPPFVVNKMRHLKVQNPEIALASAIESIILQRSGYLDDQEALTLMI